MPPQLVVLRECLIFAPGDFPYVDFVLVEEARIGDPVQPYGMPEIHCLAQYRLLSIEKLQCSVNVQHNCARNRCELSGRRMVHQEREETTQSIPTVNHNNTKDMILNTGQMRDAKWIQWFALRPPVHDLNTIVRDSVRRHFAGLPPP